METANPTEKDRKQERILQSAEKIMARQGAAATISEIAQAADVYESTIYQHFKNKEDLLFSVAEEQTRKWMLSLQGRLGGIREPVEKIRSVIGWQLQRFDAEPDFSSIVLYQCRSRRNFYFHGAFGQIGQLRAVFESILEEGIDAGIFRADIHKPALWYIVFGLTDTTYLMSAGSPGRLKAHDDLDSIMDLLMPMIMPERTRGNRRQEKTSRILKAAERIFAQKGFEHARIQEIAKAAGVSDGSIYGYFSGKDDLLFSVIKDGFTESPYKQGFKDHLFSTRALPEASPIDKLKRFIRDNLFIALIQPDFAKVLVLHGIYNQQFYQTEAFQEFLDYLSTIDGILDDGKAAGHFRSEIDNRVFRNLIVGIFSLNVLRWFLQDEGHKRDKVKEIDSLIHYLVRSIITTEAGEAGSG